MMKKVDKSSLHYWQTRNYELNGSSKKHDEKEREEIHFKNIIQLSSMLHNKEMDSLTTSILLDEERKLHADVSKSMYKDILHFVERFISLFMITRFLNTS